MEPEPSCFCMESQYIQIPYILPTIYNFNGFVFYYRQAVARIASGTDIAFNDPVYLLKFIVSIQ